MWVVVGEEVGVRGGVGGIEGDGVGGDAAHCFNFFLWFVYLWVFEVNGWRVVGE